MKNKPRLALYAIVAANIIVYANQDELMRRFEIYSIYDGSMMSMLASMFYHGDILHLTFNMAGLLKYGTKVFVDTRSHLWKSPFVVLLLYLSAGVCGASGVVGVSYLYESQWRSRLRENRYAVTCNYWLCEQMGLNAVSHTAANIYTYLYHSDEVAALWHFKFAGRIGASGAVYGIIGARLYTSYCSGLHDPLDNVEILFLVTNIAHEISQSPVQLSSLVENCLRGDGVDHTCHIFGLLSGVLLSAGIQAIANRKTRNI